MTRFRNDLLAACLALMALGGSVSAQQPAEGTDPLGDALPNGALARMGTARFRAPSPLNGVAYSPDGKLVATGAIDGVVRLWDAATGKELAQLKGHTGAVDPVVFCSGGKNVASVSAGSGGQVLVWEVATGRQVRQWKPQNRVAFRGASPDGKTLISVGADWIVRLWDTEEGKETRQVGRLPSSGFAVAALSPDGKHVATGAAGGVLQLWEAESGKELYRLEPKPEPVTPGRMPSVSALAFSPDGKVLASSGYSSIAANRAIILRDAATGKELRRLEGHSRQAPALAFSPDGKFLASASADRTVRLWGVASGKQLRQWDINPSHRLSIAFAPDGKTLAAATQDHTLRIWEAAADRELYTQVGHQGRVSAVAFLPDGKRVVSTDEDGTVLLWETATGKELDRSTGQQTATLLAVSPDGPTVLLMGYDLVLRRWRPGATRESQRLQGVINASTRYALSADGRIFAYHGREQMIHLWNLATGKVEQRLKAQRGSPLFLSPDGRRLAASGQDQKVRVWDTATGTELGQLEPTNQPRIPPLRGFSPDGRTLVTGAGSETRLWEVASGQERAVFTGPATGFRALAFSPDGRLLALPGGADGSVLVRDTATGREVASLAGHRGPVRAVAFSPDGQLLVSAGQDTTLLVWDAARLKKAQPAAAKLAPRDLAALWDELASPNAGTAYQAVRSLAAAPKQAVPFLHKRFQPKIRPDPKRIAQLIADLDSDEFAVRETATRALEALDVAAVPALKKALAGQPSLEVRRRAEALLEKSKGSWLRAVRMIEALEHMEGAEARQFLEKLAKESTDTGVKQEAQMAVQRLAGRP